MIGEVVVQDLDRDLALERPVEPPVDDGHAALTDPLEQFVLVEDLSDVDDHAFLGSEPPAADPPGSDTDVTVVHLPAWTRRRTAGLANSCILGRLRQLRQGEGEGA